MGFVDIKGKGATVLEKHSLIPPDQDHANYLKAALAQAGSPSPTVTAAVDKALHIITMADWERKAAADREKQRLAEEQKRREEEAERQRLAGEKRAAILNADYDQNDYIVIIEGQRYVRCTRCERVVPDYDTVYCGGRTTLNKGLCRECSRR